MKIFVIFVAVLLSAQAATVPQDDVTHKVTVPLPGNVLTIAKDVDVVVPAVVVEVPKHHKHNPDNMEKLVEQQTPASEETSEVTTGIPVEVDETSEVLGVSSTTPKDSGSSSVVTTVLSPVVSENSVKISQVVDGRITTTETSEDHMVSTMIPMLNDMVTHGIVESDATTVLPDSEERTTDITTIVSESEDTTTDVTSNGMEEITTLSPVVSMEVKEVPNTEEVSVVTPSQPQEEEDDKDKNSNNDSKDKPSKENSSEEVSSSLTEESHEEKEPTAKDDSILSVSSIPPISEDVTSPRSDSSSSSDQLKPSSQSDSSSSSEEVKPTLAIIPLLTDKVVIRRRRAIPFVEPSVVLSSTGPPKLQTNPKVIAEILAKSKNLQKRYKKSIQVENETTGSTYDVPLIKKSDNAEDTPATIDPCDLLCTKFEFEPICGSNGLCLHEFSNQCMLDTYNCKHPRNKFLSTKDDRCQMHWLDFCKEEEML